jgi:hypothetical protein
MTTRLVESAPLSSENSLPGENAPAPESAHIPWCESEVRVVKLYSPEGLEHGSTHPLAERIPELRGKRVGLLDNTKANAAALLDSIGHLLANEYGVADLVIRLKRERGTPANDEALDALSACDAVVTAIGD